MPFIDDNAHYTEDARDVALVRAALDGQPAVKRGRELYLPHPSMVSKMTADQRRRYDSYLNRAEFDSSCGQTASGLLGAFTRTQHEINSPAQVAYLDVDSDGDWLTMADSINVTFSNIIAVKYHILVAEFDDGGIDSKAQISRADKARFNQRSKIVHYPRESLTSWAYGVVNGRMQITHAVLTSNYSRLDDEFKTITVKRQLLLNLDADGHYRQKLIEQTGDGDAVEGGWVYPDTQGVFIGYIPIEIVSDSRNFAGSLPRATGYLGAIALKDVARYQVNADLKEKLAVMQDTINLTGFENTDWKLFEEMNGRKNLLLGMGVVNLLPANVKPEILKLSSDGDAHFKYIEENKKETRALGGRYETETEDSKTATEAAIKSAKENSILVVIASNIESAYRRLVAYCCEFEGVKVMPDTVEIAVNRQFSSSKMDVLDAEQVIKIYDAGLLSKDSALRILKAGGFGDEEKTAKEELDLIEEEAPEPLKATAIVAGGQDKNAEVLQND